MTYEQYPASAQPYNAQPYGAQPTGAAPGGEPPIGEPYFDCGFGKSLGRFFKGYVKFSGRASRAEYWWSYLWLNIILFIPLMIYLVGATIAAMQFSFALSFGMSDAEIWGFIGSVFAWMIPLWIVSLAIMLPSYSAMWRRLHDAGFSGAFTLLNLIGLSIIPLIMCIMPTSPEAEKYGPGGMPRPKAPAPAPYPQQYPPQQY